MTVDRAELVSHAMALRGASLLCVGDVMLDRFIHGDVERISPEAPIPVLRIARETAMLGGAGNVVRNAAALGAASRFVAVIGEDEAGREIGRLVGAEPLIAPTLLAESSRPTTIKVRFFASHQQLLRVDRETQDDLPDGVRERLLAAAGPLFEGAGAVVLSDYGKGVLSSESVRRLIDAARAAGKPVVVDPKGTDYTIYRGATVVTPNRKELHQATGMPVDSDQEIVAAATHLIESCGIESVLATRSQDGMSLVTSQGRVYHLPAEAREVFDVSGAGDTVVATLAAALATGAPLALAARLANVAAGIVVAKVGTAVARSDELLAALSHGDAMDGQAKIAVLDKAGDRIEAWRRKGKTVGFTNGCFDLLHPGHVSLLSQAKSHCDRLVVGLNSDASVKRLKGPARPVQDEVSRATVLAALAAVDLVVIFGEDTPLETIRALAPDVLVKGADYTIDKVVGADFVLARGGRVVLADLVDGQSTTATIGKMTR